MPTPVTLPRLTWGGPSAARTALLVHGVGSTAALMWRIGTALAENGWLATAVDLRGHGAAPRTLDYTLAAYAADLEATVPSQGSAWDVVIGHSLGGASSIVASAANPAWARRLVPIDPAIVVSDAQAEEIANSLAASAANPPTAAELQAANPRWHPLDAELKALAVRGATAWSLAQTMRQNRPWDVRAEAAALQVPMHVIAADPAQPDALFAGSVAEEVLASHPLISASVVTGAGHSPHRDAPEAFLTKLFAALGQ